MRVMQFTSIAVFGNPSVRAKMMEPEAQFYDPEDFVETACIDLSTMF